MVSRAVRCLLVWLITTVPLLGISWLSLGNIRGAGRALSAGTLPAQSFETLLLWLCSAAILGCCLWLWATTTMVVAALAGGRARTRVRGCPDFLRRAILVACGVAIAGTFALPVQAAPDAASEHPSATGSQTSSPLSGLPLPDRALRTDLAPDADAPTRPLPHAPATRAHATKGATEVTPTVVVRTGDTLWALAADALDPGATAAEIADHTHQLHTLNRDVVGSDPDQIYPGQELRLPGGEQR